MVGLLVVVGCTIASRFWVETLEFGSFEHHGQRTQWLDVWHDIRSQVVAVISRSWLWCLLVSVFGGGWQGSGRVSAFGWTLLDGSRFRPWRGFGSWWVGVVLPCGAQALKYFCH